MPHLPRQQLLGQHRECAALRGNGWGKKHSVVDYVFEYSPIRLFAYYFLVMKEMQKRGYNVGYSWGYIEYRGKNCEPYKIFETGSFDFSQSPIYPEHNDEYLNQCLENLKSKGVEINA